LSASNNIAKRTIEILKKQLLPNPCAKGKLARNKLPIIGISISSMIQRTCLRGKLLELISTN